MKPSWVTKTDPEKHPVRFLASIWQEKMKANFGVLVTMTPKEMGQLRALRLRLGDLTTDVIKWIVDPVNWWFFCQQVRSGWKTIFVPDYPHVGFLLARRGVALRVMRCKLGDSSEFVQKLDLREFEQTRTLAVVSAHGKPERLAKIEASKTVTDIQKVLNEFFEESAADSTQAVQPLKTSA